jgi:Protein of unknown function (DUF3108)
MIKSYHKTATSILSKPHSADFLQYVANALGAPIFNAPIFSAPTLSIPTLSTPIFSIPILSTLILTLTLTNFAQAQTTLTPYTATYTASYSGLSTELERELKNKGNNGWSLSNESSLLFATFTEKASFQFHQGKLVPRRYQYENPISSKRDSKLNFNWDKGLVTESARDNSQLELPPDALDKLTFQLQLRLDLIKQEGKLNNKTYTLVDSTKLKSYTVEYIGEEKITTPTGTYNTIKIKKQRPGKDKHTIIWLAKDWQYIILQIERFEKGEIRYKLELQSATLNGTKMAAK